MVFALEKGYGLCMVRAEKANKNVEQRNLSNFETISIS